jgi:hypothetical protein
LELQPTDGKKWEVFSKERRREERAEYGGIDTESESESEDEDEDEDEDVIAAYGSNGEDDEDELDALRPNLDDWEGQCDDDQDGGGMGSLDSLDSPTLRHTLGTIGADHSFRSSSMPPLPPSMQGGGTPSSSSRGGARGPGVVQFADGGTGGIGEDADAEPPPTGRPKMHKTRSMMHLAGRIGFGGVKGVVGVGVGTRDSISLGVGKQRSRQLAQTERARTRRQTRGKQRESALKAKRETLRSTVLCQPLVMALVSAEGDHHLYLRAEDERDMMKWAVRLYHAIALASGGASDLMEAARQQKSLNEKREHDAAQVGLCTVLLCALYYYCRAGRFMHCTTVCTVLLLHCYMYTL